MIQARLQFRWEATDKPADEFGARDWICKYEISIPLDPHDIRREDEDHNNVRDAHVIELGSTKRGSCQVPCVSDDGSFYFDAPYRDGAHATWDAPKLGNIPIVCISIDGTIIPKPIKSDDAPPQTNLRSLDWSNFTGLKRNVEWAPGDQELIYTAINFRDDEYGDKDDDAGQQIVERLLAAWQNAEMAAGMFAAHRQELLDQIEARPPQNRETF